jgi:HSP20 family molecular chaperone IbpA
MARLTADVYDTPGGEAYVIEIPVPGLSPDEIVIEVEAGKLIVRTEPSQRNPEAGRRYLQREHIVEPMSRVRRALELRFLDGVAPQAVAEAMGKPVQEAERIVEHARAFLRQRLLETGCVLQAAQS